MGHQENRLTTERLKNLKPWQRRFRINAGMGWVATPKNTVRIDKTRNVTVNKGDMILRQARPFRGAPKGWADLCGFDSIIVTPEMVGDKIAVFVFEEVKATGDLNTDQNNFKKLILSMGGRFFKLTND